MHSTIVVLEMAYCLSYFCCSHNTSTQLWHIALYKCGLIVWLSHSRIRSIKQCRFQWPWATHDPDFKVAAFFAIKYAKNGARYSHSYYWTLVGSHMRPIERCHFQWPWMTPNPGFKVMVIFKGEYYSERRILYCPTTDNLSYLTSSTMCRWRAVPQR